MKRLALVIAIALVLVAGTAEAVVFDLTAQGIKLKGNTPDMVYAYNNRLNGSRGWFDEDSGTFTTVLRQDTDAVAGDDTVVGMAINPLSKPYSTAGGITNGVYNTPVGAYFGGIFMIRAINFDTTNIPVGRELTGIFYGMQASQPVLNTDPNATSTMTLVGADGLGNLNYSFSNTSNGATFAFDVLLEGGAFAMYSDDVSGVGATKFNQLGPVDITTNVDLKTGTQTGGGETDWADAIDSDFAPTPFLTGTLTESIRVHIKGEIIDDPSLGLLTINYNSPQLTNLDGKGVAFNTTGGALYPIATLGETYPLSADDDAGKYRKIDGQFKLNDFGFSADPPNATVAENLDGTWNTGITIAATPQTDGCEFVDDVQINVGIIPDPATVAFMAPVLFGFLGHSFARRRRRKK